MTFKAIDANDIRMVSPRSMDSAMATAMLSDGWEEMVNRSVCGTAMVEDGEIVAVGGIVRMWEGSGHAWTLLGSNLRRRHMAMVHRKTMQMLTIAHVDLGMWRVQCDVRADFEAGHRWAVRLGFVPEGTLRRYSPDGFDHVLYARIMETT